MTQEQHPITPPDELIEQWLYDGQLESSVTKYIATQAARWGADMELDACCSWVEVYAECGGSLRTARRPKPPSLKEQALKELHHIVERLPEGTLFSDAAILRAIESLPD